MKPQRIQLRRTKGWRMPPNTVKVARPTKWGNPFKVADCIDAEFASDVPTARKVCVEAFRDWLRGDPWATGDTPEWETRRKALLNALPQLRGKALACFCPLDQPCHADVLLELSNAP